MAKTHNFAEDLIVDERTKRVGRERERNFE